VRICLWPCRQEKHGEIMLPQVAKGIDGRVSEELCASAVAMANALDASAIFVYTRRGYMANFLSRCRPDAPVFAFTGAAVLVAWHVHEEAIRHSDMLQQWRAHHCGHRLTTSHTPYCTNDCALCQIRHPKF